MKLELNLEEVNIILAGLMQLPMAHVEQLVFKVREQAKQQIQESDPVVIDPE